MICQPRDRFQAIRNQQIETMVSPPNVDRVTDPPSAVGDPFNSDIVSLDREYRFISGKIGKIVRVCLIVKLASRVKPLSCPA